MRSVARNVALTAVESEYDALIIGGGPAGYAAALALARNGFTKLRLLERHPGPDFVNSNKANVYMIMYAGKDSMHALGLTDAEAVGHTLPGKRQIRVVRPNGEAANRELGPDTPVPEAIAPTEFSRVALIRYLRDGALRSAGERLHVTYATRAASIELPSGHDGVGAGTGPGAGPRIIVTALPAVAPGREQPEGPEERIACRLLVGADGGNSSVRRALEAAHPGEGFEQRVFWNPSAGLAFKAMPIPEGVPFVKGEAPPKGTLSAFFPAQPVGSDGVMHFGIFGGGLSGLQCTFSVPEDHPFWQLKDPDEFFAYMAAAYPQLTNIREVMSPERVASFLSAPYSLLPPIEHADRFVRVYGGGAAAVLLLGDAAHSFAPDHGQGVNCALQDARDLSGALAAHPGDLSAALEEYDAARVPEAKGICQLMKYGAPLQYASVGNKWQRALWTADTIVRVIANKLLPQVFAPLVFIQMMYKDGVDGTMSYQKLVAQQRANTAKLLGLLGFLVAVIAVVIRKVMSTA